MIKKIFVVLNCARSIVPFMFLKNDGAFLEDFNRWKMLRKIESYPDIIAFTYLGLFYKEFRNLFLYRLKERSLGLEIISKIFWKPMDTCYINTKNIGGGLFLEHGFSTVISAKAIGNNCWINQQVTIGYTNDVDAPIIGNNVSIKAGAIVIGNVHIGDNSIVGANAVVTHDVPANVVVAGVPAKIIKNLTDLCEL